LPCSAAAHIAATFVAIIIIIIITTNHQEDLSNSVAFNGEIQRSCKINDGKV